MAVDQHLKLSVGVADFRLNAVFRFEFALKAPGQATFVGSNQAAADFDFGVRVHRFDWAAKVIAPSREPPTQRHS